MTQRCVLASFNLSKIFGANNEFCSQIRVNDAWQKKFSPSFCARVYKSILWICFLKWQGLQFIFSPSFLYLINPLQLIFFRILYKGQMHTESIQLNCTVPCIHCIFPVHDGQIFSGLLLLSRVNVQTKHIQLWMFCLMLSTTTLTFLCTLQDKSIDPVSVAPAGVGLRVWETKAEA